MERALQSLKLALEQTSEGPISIEEVNARQRAGWPDFRLMIPSEMEQLAALRKLSFGGSEGYFRVRRPEGPRGYRQTHWGPVLGIQGKAARQAGRGVFGTQTSCGGTTKPRKRQKSKT
jgi:hypothetical protein